MSTLLRIGDAEFLLDFELPEDAELPAGVERVEATMEEEETWSDLPAELLTYAQELAIAPDQVAHWVAFLTEHPAGRRTWEEIRRIGSPPRRRKGRRRPS